MSNPLASRVVNLLKEVLTSLGVDDVDPRVLLEVPPKPQMGDYAFPCFQLARSLRKAPPAIAAQVAETIPDTPWLKKVEVVGPYVNFFLEPGEAGRCVVQRLLEEGEAFGQKKSDRAGCVVIDFSSPNIAKPFHVGHLRSTMIGNSLARLFETQGYRVVRLNFLGDWGTQFGKLIVAYRKWGSKQRLEEEPIRTLLDLYVDFHREAEKDPSLDEEARAAFKALEEGAPEEVALWRWFRDLSLQEFERHYQRLGVTFDVFTGESAYNERVDDTIARMDELGLLTTSEGAIVVELDDLPPCLIKKSDGATLYATRDISAAIHRYEEFAFEHLLYVVGAPQQLHFQQVFAVLKLMGFEWAERAEHVPFGHIRIGDEQLSTRRGNVVFLEDLLDQAAQRAASIIEERNPDLPNKEEVAEAVGVGAIVFNDLVHNRIKDVSFDWESLLSFEGDTGPYVQYTHARTASLLRRAADRLGTPSVDWIQGEHMQEAETFQLVKRLAEFPQVLERAVAQREPSEVARYLLLLCQDFNTFYHAHRILETVQERTRLALVAAVKSVLAQGLYLLGIKAPDAM